MKEILINNFSNLNIWEKYTFCIKQIDGQYINQSDLKINFKFRSTSDDNINTSTIIGKKQELNKLNLDDIDKSVIIQFINPKALWETSNILSIDDDCKINDIPDDALKPYRLKLLEFIDSGRLTNIRSTSNKFGHMLLKIKQVDKFNNLMNTIQTQNSQFKVDFSAKMQKLFSLNVSGRNITYYNQYLNSDRLLIEDNEVEELLFNYLFTLNTNKNKDDNTDNNKDKIKKEVKSNVNEFNVVNFSKYNSMGLKRFTLHMFEVCGFKDKLINKMKTDGVKDHYIGFKSFLQLIRDNCYGFINNELADQMIEIIRSEFKIPDTFDNSTLTDLFEEELDQKLLSEYSSKYKINKEKNNEIICYGKEMNSDKYAIFKKHNNRITKSTMNLSQYQKTLNSYGIWCDEFTKYTSFIEISFDYRNFSDKPIDSITVGLLRELYDDYSIQKYINYDLSKIDDDVWLVNTFEQDILNKRLNRLNYLNNTIKDIEFNDLSDTLKANLNNMFKSHIYGDEFALEAGIHLLAAHFVFNRKSNYMMTFIGQGGVGKDTFMEILKSIYGSWYKWEIDKSSFFSKQIENASIIYVEEGKIKDDDYWKQIISSRDISVNIKYEDSRSVDFSYKQLFMTCNDINNIKKLFSSNKNISAAARRLCLFESYDRQIFKDDNLIIDLDNIDMIKDICNELSSYLYTYSKKYSYDEFINKCKEYELLIKSMNEKYFNSLINTNDDINTYTLDDDIKSYIDNCINNKNRYDTLKDMLDVIYSTYRLSNNIKSVIKVYIVNALNIDVSITDLKYTDRIKLNN